MLLPVRALSPSPYPLIPESEEARVGDFMNYNYVRCPAMEALLVFSILTVLDISGSFRGITQSFHGALPKQRKRM